MSEHTLDEKHKHRVNGKEYKSTTEILEVIAKPALIQWAADVAAVNALNNLELTKRYDEFTKIPYGPQRKQAKAALDRDFPEFKAARLAHSKKKDKAADWGTIVHKAIESWIKTKSIPVTVDVNGVGTQVLPEHLAAINNFVEWATKEKFEFLMSEELVHSEEWEIGGVVDFVGKKDGKLFIGDIKTTSGIYETQFLQVAAYGKMMMEMGLYDFFDGMVIVNCKKDGTLEVEERKDVAGNIKCYEAARILHNRLN